ncbi:unnamed protein product [Pocillopora meandrina]|uniref:Uncharacterized protein n=1 Tax=Pocillopora meandrina TaxID=46732 RepID=A0AAU9W485_9CNID|nr:unnamed protein product [Pocillopora meandrina]
MHEVADHINHALLEPLEEYRLTDEIPKIPLEEDHAPEFLFWVCWILVSLKRYQSRLQPSPSLKCSTFGCKGLIETDQL